MKSAVNNEMHIRHSNEDVKQVIELSVAFKGDLRSRNRSVIRFC